MTGENDTEENLTGPRVAVVTGASSGLGLAAARMLAERGWTVAIVGRDAERLRVAADHVQAAAHAPIGVFRCDYARLAEVRDLAAALREAYPRIDVLANNAGGVVGSERSTVDGYEATIQTNHLAPFLLSHQLRDRLAGGRIVNTASRVHAQGRIDPDNLSRTGRRYRKLVAYACAKQADVLFAAEAARRWPEIVSASHHPGLVRTRFGNEDPRYARFFRLMPGLRTPAQGAETLVWLSTVEPAAVESGRYYVDCRARPLSRRAADPALAARVWEASLVAVGLG